MIEIRAVLPILDHGQLNRLVSFGVLLCEHHSTLDRLEWPNHACIYLLRHVFLVL
jgi:hypothetical protein